MISVHFQGKPFNITAIQICVTPTNSEEAGADFYEDLQDLLEPKPKKMSFSSLETGMKKQKVKKYLE